jgi:type I site-specific restriction endonuclease
LIDKKSLSESDICAKYITPAVLQSGWDEVMQIRREVYFTGCAEKPCPPVHGGDEKRGAVAPNNLCSYPKLLDILRP